MLGAGEGHSSRQGPSLCGLNKVLGLKGGQECPKYRSLRMWGELYAFVSVNSY